MKEKNKIIGYEVLLGRNTREIQIIENMAEEVGQCYLRA